MLSRIARRVALKNFTGARSYSSFDRDFQILANAMTRDFERSLSRSFGPWDFFRPRSSFFSEPVFYQPIRSTYEKKTIMNDKNGNLVVKTVRKSPGRPWETYVEEYTNDKSLEQGKKVEALEQTQNSKANSQTAKDKATSQQQNKEQSQASPSTDQQQQTIEKDNTQSNKADGASTNSKQQSTEGQPDLPKSQSQQPVTQQQHGSDMFSLFDQHFQELSESMTRDFDRYFGIRSSFGGWNWFEPEYPFFNSENTSYSVKTVINNNGNITVKTAMKNPESEWETSVKQYSQDNAVEGGKKAEAIGETSQSEQEAGEKIEGEAASDQTGNKNQDVSQ